MAGSTNTLIVEGSFEELSAELATYLDKVAAGAGGQPQSQSSVSVDIEPLLKEGKREDVLKKLVTASTALNNAPEREYIAAYNQLVHLVRQAPKPEMFLPRICQHLSQPVASSQYSSTGLQLNVLTTIFNILPADSDSRYHVLLAILTIIRKQSQNFDLLRPQLKMLDVWLQNWDVDKEDQRKLYMAVHDVASDSGDETAASTYLRKALGTIQDADEVSSDEATQLSIKAITTALLNPSTFDFSDLVALDSVQALRKAEPRYFELLEIFSTETLDDYNAFVAEHSSWVSSTPLAEHSSALENKIRQLTLASLAAAASQTRTLGYDAIASALKIDTAQVERWVIDVIRAGLVEGRLSQSQRLFLVHRATYRRFGELQWREVAARLDMWKRSLENVLQVLAEQRRDFVAERERETEAGNASGRDFAGPNHSFLGGGGTRSGQGFQRGGGGGFGAGGVKRSQQSSLPQQQQQQQQQPQAVEVE